MIVSAIYQNAISYSTTNVSSAA